MRPPMRGGRGGRDGGRGGGFGGRGGGGFGGRGGGFGGRGGGGRGGWQDQGPPESVIEAGCFAHACEGEAVVKLTNEKVRLSLHSMSRLHLAALAGLRWLTLPH